MAIRVDYTEKDLIEMFRNTITDKEHINHLIEQVNNGKIIPIRGYGYGTKGY
jgi:hypothetical protein